MARKMLKKQFESGRGYTKDDWDTVDSPELTDEELAGMKPFREVLPAMAEKIEREIAKRGRPPVERPKLPVTIRLDQDVIEKFKATGKGWQSRINDILKQAKV